MSTLPSNAPEKKPRGKGPAVPFPPPLLFAAAFLAGWLIHRASPLWPPIPVAVAATVTWFSGVLVVAGLAFAYWGIYTFTRHRTAIYPNRDASTLVMTGPYRYTRNPMYTGMIVAYLGGVGIVESLWPLVTLPLAIIGLYRIVIAREERHLTQAFGDAYREYQRRVGRWF